MVRIILLFLTLLLAGTTAAQTRVQTHGIADEAVTTAKIDDNAVTTAKVALDTLTAADLAPDSVGVSELQADAVGAAEIAADAVGTSEIADGTIAAADLATSAAVEPYLEYRDEKAAGTDGGTCTSGSFATRTINTEVSDAGGYGALSANQITLTAGTYEVWASAPALVVDNHQARLRNVTDGTTVIVGSSAYSGSGNTNATTSIVTGRFTIGASKALEIQHRCQTTKATNGYGDAANFGEVEVYTIVRFWKVG